MTCPDCNASMSLTNHGNHDCPICGALWSAADMNTLVTNANTALQPPFALESIEKTITDFQRMYGMATKELRAGDQFCERFAGMLEKAGMLYKDESVSVPTRIHGVPVYVDPTLPRGIAQMRDANGKMIQFDLRTDAEKEADSAQGK